MITETKTNVIERKGVESEGKFQIKATGKAFRILSDGLYSDKIRAIMRELSCNAYDAHVSANNLDTQFVIHLPNRLEPHFKIRDYGVGLSHDDIVNVYTTYFESTKTDSNEFIGCLGLGSKSPFSYVDSFSIVSFFGGEKRVYNAFINEEETPTIALMATTKSDEANGLEVSFPVQANDTHRFEEKAYAVFEYFKLKPKFLGAKVEIEPVKYVLESSNWAIRETQYRGSANAIMGNVCYSLADFSGDIEDDSMRNLIHSVPIDIVFPIGELEVAASRENLSYNKRTIANVKKMLKQMIKEIREKANEKIKDCGTLWEARVLAYEIVQGEYKHLKGVLEGQNIFEWKGTTLGDSYIKIDNKELGIICFAPKSNWRRRSNSTGTIISRNDTTAIQTKKSTRIFWADINRGSHLRCRQVILDSEPVGEKDYNGNYKEREVNSVYLVSGSKVDIEALRVELGVDTIPAISTIEKKKNSSVYKTADYNPKNATRLLIHDTDDSNHDYSVPSTYWHNEKVKVGDGGVYVNINRYKIHGEHPYDYLNRMSEIFDLMDKDMDDLVIVGAKDSVVGKLEAEGIWKTLEVYLKEELEAYVKDNKLSRKIKDACTIQSFNTNSGRIVKLVMDMNLDKTKPCGKFAERVKKMRASVKDVETLVKVGRAMNRLDISNTGKGTGTAIDLHAEWDKIQKGYPLLEDVDSWRIDERKKYIEEYIQALDMVKF